MTALIAVLSINLLAGPLLMKPGTSRGSVNTPSGASSGSILQIDVAPSGPTPIGIRDPNRQIGGTVWTLQGPDANSGWMSFFGQVVNVQPNGVCISGHYSGFGDAASPVLFFVENFPYSVADGDKIGMPYIYMAKDAGTYLYSTQFGSSTIHMLDYGKIYVPPPLTPEQIQAKKKAAEALKAKRDAAYLQRNQELADKNDPFGLLKMGERYRDGDGVEKDLAKATNYLSKAAAMGDPTAARELKAIKN